MFPQKAYEKGNAQNLQRVPHVLKSGLQKNVRMVGDSPEDATPIIQIYQKKGAFFPPGPLGAFLEQILPGAEPLRKKIFDDKNFRIAVKQVKRKSQGSVNIFTGTPRLDLVVSTNHLDVINRFTINGLTRDGADKVEFDYDGSIISVEDYYRR